MTADDSEEQKPGDGGPQVGTRYTAEEIHENISKAAKEEMDRPAGELLWSGVASGLLIGFSFLAVAFLAPLMPDRLRALAGFLAYPLGFVFVVLARHQLFTENTLEPVIPVLERRDRRTLHKLLRLWGIVLPANLAGALVFAIVLARTSVVEPALQASLLDVARHSTAGGFGLVLYRAVWAGWLVALMAWLIASTRETLAQIALVWLTTGPIAALGFKHSIAGAVECFYQAAVGDATWGRMLFAFELPALVGNVLGGVVLVALVNHGQVSGRDGAERER